MLPEQTGPLIAIGFCTYRRPVGLARALEHIGGTVASLGRAVAVIVVDNDGADPQIAQIVAQQSQVQGLEVHYVIESTPGISAARNAVFARADALGVRHLAMLDDDEWPAPGWLPALLRRQAETQAVVVGGPVEPVFPEAAADMRRYARLWAVEPQLLDGKPFVFCTCNFLIDLSAIKDVQRPLFESELGLSGSEDTVFFRSLFYRGFAMAWASDALLYEEVTSERATLTWLRRRRFAAGNHAVGWEARDRGRLRTFLKTLGMTGRLLIYPALGREHEAPLIGWLLQWERVRGRYAAHSGKQFQGYARPVVAAGSPRLKSCR